MKISPKKKILLFLHRILMSFSPKWHDKIVMIVKILLQDWRLQPCSNYQNSELFWDLLHTSKEELQLFRSLDDVSIQTVGKYIDGQCSAYLKNYGEFFYHIPFAISSAEERKLQRELCRMRKKFYLGNEGDLASLVLGHGLECLESEVKAYVEEKIFIDAGAYIGDSCLGLLKYKPACVYSFEISPRSGQRYLETMKKNGIPKNKYRLIRKGLSDASGEFTDFQDTANPGTQLHFCGGTETVSIIRLDDFWDGHSERIGFLKTDVEGFGVAAIRGAEKIIRRDRPVLSLAIYHSKEELFGTYALLKNWNLDYRFQIRKLNFPRFNSELVLLGVPFECLKKRESHPGKAVL